MRSSFVSLGLAAGLYVVLTIAITWPLALHIGDRVPNDPGDSLLNMFLLAWNARVLPLGERWWNLPQFFPIPGTMAFSEHLLGLGPITTPIIAATGNALAAYNVAFLLSFPLCALAAHLLGVVLTGRHALGLVAGIAYGFSPYRMSQLSHIQVLSSYWMPLALVGLHLFLRTPRWRWAALFAASWLMQALACGYFLFFLTVLVGLWMLWFVPGRLRWTDMTRIGIAWAVAVVAYVPIAIGYWRFQHAYGLRRWPAEIESFSADIASVLTAPHTLRVWGWLSTVDRPESAFFPGLALIGLVAAGAALAWMPGRARDDGRGSTWALLLVALVIAMVAITPALIGAWSIDIFGTRLLSVSSSQKPLSLAVFLTAVSLAMHPSTRAAWRRKSVFAFYTLAAGAMWVFSLGPSPTLMNEPVLYKAPYAWLMMLPGMDAVRVPARFWVLATMCLAMTAASVTGRLGARWPRLRDTLPPVVVCLLLIESWPHPLMLTPEPDARPAHTIAMARLELPSSPAADRVALYRAIAHRRPVLNGYSGYFAPHYRAMQYLLDQRDPEVLSFLRTFGSIEVVVDHDRDPDGKWRAYLSRQMHAELVHSDDASTAFRFGRLPARPRPMPLPGERLPVTGIDASHDAHRLSHMLDGNLATRWDTGAPQRPIDYVVLDLGAARRVQGIELQLGGFVADFPRNLVIETSTDLTTWDERWSGGTGLMALVAALDSPRTIPLRFPLEGGPARYIRLRQTDRDSVFFWSIAELHVYGPTS